MCNIIKKNIFKITKKYKKFLISYSGGLDSTVLLYNFKKIKDKNNQIKIRAIHVNHNINKLSNIWEQHCKNICKTLKIKLVIEKIYIKTKNNLESQLRQHRYHVLKKNLLKKEILLTAHNINDQCETVLLSLKRGCGLQGISGIKKYINKKKYLIIRPLLNIDKHFIQKYAIKHNLLWIEDESNNNIKYDRNFLRHRILPLLLKRWPYILNNIYRSTKIFYKQNILIKKLLKNKTKFFIINKKIKLKNFYSLNKQEIFFIIRKWIEINHKKMLSYKLTKLIYKTIFSLKHKFSFQLNFKEFNIGKYRNFMFIFNKIIIKKKQIWCKNKKFFHLANKLGYLYIDYKNNKQDFLVRKPYDYEQIYVQYKIKSKTKILHKKFKTVKSLWQHLKIPPWERQNKPVIYYNKKPIISPNLFITKESQKKNKMWYIKWNKN